MQRQISRYSQWDTDESDKEFNSVSASDWNDVSESDGTTVFAGQPEVHESLQANGSRTPIDPNQLQLIRAGDHIGWHRPYLIWHHAIVVDVDYQNRKLLVIHFTKVKKIAEVAEEWINIDKQKGDLFRFNYGNEIENENPPEKVIQRARTKIGERGYGLLKKNCEHFATYCKTGKGDSAQVHWAWKKTKEVLHTGAVNITKAGTRFGCAVAKEMSKQTGESVIASAGKVGGAEISEKIARGSNWVGAGVVAGVETFHCAYDIYHIRKNYKAGNMTKRDFCVTTTQRVSEGVLGGSFAIGASLFGEWVGGLIGGAIGSVAPGIGTAVGAFVGSVVFGAIGSFSGKVLGSIFGRWFGNKIW